MAKGATRGVLSRLSCCRFMGRRMLRGGTPRASGGAELEGPEAAAVRVKKGWAVPALHRRGLRAKREDLRGNAEGVGVPLDKSRRWRWRSRLLLPSTELSASGWPNDE